jgi:hypothetical protein
MRSACSALVLALVLVAAGCTAPAGAPAPVAATGPSETAEMVCTSDAQEDIAHALGVAAQRVEPPTWTDRRYACRYVYAGGSFLMSVKDLANDRETTDHYASLAAQLGSVRNVPGLGEGAFVTRDGSVVVRKDFKVLVVDGAALPPALSDPPLTPGNVALLVAKTIIECWIAHP